MWAKEFRFLVFVGIYNFSFWDLEFAKKKFSEEDLLYLISLSYSSSEIKPKLLKKDIKEIHSYIKKIYKSKERYKTILLNYLKDWDKTYLLTQSILLTFLCELEFIQTNRKEEGNIVGKYIRLNQDMVGGQSTALVHAISSKIIESKLDLTES